MRKILFVFAILFCQCFYAAFADSTPVLLRVPRADQNDSIGCNFVEQFTILMYDEIVAGHVKLWDSPSKEIQITGITLQELEKASDTKFVEQEIFYIYENWQKAKTGIISNTIGFTFLNKNARGEDVSYGFVDYKDLKEILKLRINTNADGLYSINYATYLYKKLFNYNIVQFAGKTISTGGESSSIKADFVGDMEFNPTVTLPAIPDRLVTYFIDEQKTSEDQKAKNSRDLIRNLQAYFMFNGEVFFNLGGDKLSDLYSKNKMKITRIEFTEIWKKSDEGIYYLPKTVNIFANDTALNTISFNEFLDFGIQVDSKSVLQLISDKDFSFIITNINSQKIARKDAYLYYKGLMTYDWKKVIEFVKFY